MPSAKPDLQPVERILHMISPKQVAAALGIDKGTVLRLIRKGTLPASKFSSKTIRVRVADVEAYAEARKV